MKKQNYDQFQYLNPVAALDGNVIMNRGKDVSICYKLELPEIFTMGSPEFNDVHGDFLKMFNNLPEDTIIHKKDIFLIENYDPKILKQDTPLQKSTYNHFKGRKYTKHECYLTFILPDLPPLQKSYSNVSVIRKSNDIKALEYIEKFKTAVSQSVNALMASNLLKVIPATEEEIIRNIFNELTAYQNKICNLQFHPKFEIGDQKIKIYTVNDDGQLKDGTISPCVVDRKGSVDEIKFYRPYVYPIGLELAFSHVYNQFIYLDNQNKIKKELELNTKRLRGSNLFSRKNRLNAQTNENFLNEIEKENWKIVRMHTNIMAWGETPEQLKFIDDSIISAYTNMDMTIAEADKYEYDFLYMANLLGNGSAIPKEDTIQTYLNVAVCYFNFESNYRTSPKGILFNDRISNIPIYIDVFNAPYEDKDITNRNYIIIAPSGSGKSVLAKSKIRQQIENPENVTVVLNVGGDDKMCRMYPDDSLYFKYQEGQPLELNPFWLWEHTINSVKIEFLIDFVGLLWKNGQELNNDEISGLEKIIFKFYGIEGVVEETTINKGGNGKEEKILKFACKNTDNNSIPKFFNFLKENREEIKTDTANLVGIDSLILNLEKYAVGTYSNLFHTGEPRKFENKKYVEFELDNIKDHQILFPIFGMVISDLVFNTMWNLDDKEKDFFIDEAWKVLEKKGMASLLKYLYKTIRKFDGSVGIAIQQITDLEHLGSDERAILGNTAIKYILDHGEVLADVPILKEKLSLKDAYVSMLLSIANTTKSDITVNKYRYTEVLLIMGSKIAKVVRLEISKPCLAIYESDKKKLKVFDDIYYNKKNQNIIETISEYINVEIDKTKKLELI